MLAALLPVVGLAAAPVARAATAFTFSPPSKSPLEASGNYTGASNGTLATQSIVPGAVFDRFIQVCNGVAKKKWFGAECTLC